MTNAFRVHLFSTALKNIFCRKSSGGDQQLHLQLQLQLPVPCAAEKTIPAASTAMQRFTISICCNAADASTLDLALQPRNSQTMEWYSLQKRLNYYFTCVGVHKSVYILT